MLTNGGCGVAEACEVVDMSSCQNRNLSTKHVGLRVAGIGGSIGGHIYISRVKRPYISCKRPYIVWSLIRHKQVMVHSDVKQAGL